MKWSKPDGGVQKSTDGKYSVVRATLEPEIWIAYAISPFKSTGDELGVKSCAEDARQVCEDHERDEVAFRRRA